MPETISDRVDDLYALLAEKDRMERRIAELQATTERQASLCSYLEDANELLSDQVAALLVENTRLRIARTKDAA